MKSIRELLIENESKPLWLQRWDDEVDSKFFVVAIAPDSWAVGWNEKGTVDYHRSDSRQWVRGEDPAIAPAKAVL